jgi:hypothetical protein
LDLERKEYLGSEVKERNLQREGREGGKEGGEGEGSEVIGPMKNGLGHGDIWAASYNGLDGWASLD